MIIAAEQGAENDPALHRNRYTALMTGRFQPLEIDAVCLLCYGQFPSSPNGDSDGIISMVALSSPLVKYCT